MHYTQIFFTLQRFQEHGDTIKNVIWQTAVSVLSVGVDVVLDFSFWGKEEREKYKGLGQLAGADTQLYYLCAPDKVLRDRVQKRNMEMRMAHYRKLGVCNTKDEGTDEHTKCIAAEDERVGGDVGSNSIYVPVEAFDRYCKTVSLCISSFVYCAARATIRLVSSRTL